MTPDEIAGYYADNDIYIQSPNIDNMPTSVLEAFASGLPVVSTEAGGVPAILTHGVHGLLAPLADYETLGRHVLRLLDDPGLRARSSRARRLPPATPARGRAVREQWLQRVSRACSAGAHVARRDSSRHPSDVAARAAVHHDPA